MHKPSSSSRIPHESVTAIEYINGQLDSGEIKNISPELIISSLLNLGLKEIKDDRLLPHNLGEVEFRCVGFRNKECKDGEFWELYIDGKEFRLSKMQSEIACEIISASRNGCPDFAEGRDIILRHAISNTLSVEK